MVTKSKIPVEIFDCEIVVIVADDVMQSINYFLRRDGEKTIEVEVAGYTYRPGGEMNKYYLFFARKGLSVNYINHEKSHVTEHMLLDRGIKPVDEIRSYLDGFISQKLDKFFKSRSIKISNK